jgi:hypothetical protein
MAVYESNGYSPALPPKSPMLQRRTVKLAHPDHLPLEPRLLPDCDAKIGKHVTPYVVNRSATLPDPYQGRAVLSEACSEGSHKSWAKI